MTRNVVRQLQDTRTGSKFKSKLAVIIKKCTRVQSRFIIAQIKTILIIIKVKRFHNRPKTDIWVEQLVEKYNQENYITYN